MLEGGCVIKFCICCKDNHVGESGVMCENCWDWITKEMSFTDVCMVIAGIASREPNNKLAVNI